MKQIVPNFPAPAVEELLELPNPRKMLADLASFFEEYSLTGSSNLTVTLADADVPGIGRATNVELRVNGRFCSGGDLCVVTDLGFVNVSTMVRRIEALLDVHESKAAS